MRVFNLFSKRKAEQAGHVPEHQVACLPDKFRVQSTHILLSSIRPWQVSDPWDGPPLTSGNTAWLFIFRAVTDEHGLHGLSDARRSPADQCLDYLLTAGTDEALDLMEVALGYIDDHVSRVRPDFYFEFGLDPRAVEAVRVFNVRCRENGVGYQFEQGRIVPAGSTFIHDEVVRPALVLLQQEGFRGPQEEFLGALAKLRAGDHKGAILDAGKAFESAMKSVCTRKGWAYDAEKDTASKLIGILFANALVPPYLQNQFTGLRTLLESGVPTVRNKTSGHGQGPEPVEVPREVAEYAVHLAATNIVFMARLAKQR